MNVVQQWEEMPTNKGFILGQIALFLSEPACPKMAPLANTISAVTDDWKPYQKFLHTWQGNWDAHTYAQRRQLRHPEAEVCMLIHDTHQSMETHAHGQVDSRIVFLLNNLIWCQILKAAYWTQDYNNKKGQGSIIQRSGREISGMENIR